VKFFLSAGGAEISLDIAEFSSAAGFGTGGGGGTNNS
jgi:hypothetical protein